ncbi:MAG: hypothetical protein SV775_19005, partial [Thermodesulfobacteriota bacterium]|nr:hypothetical protein [Thermodesulfobacteriota bacterium]
RKLDGIHGNAIPEPEEETFEQKTETLDFQELLSIYKASYEQLAALKHLVYSSTHLSDPESLALHFSKQIDERMRPEKNSVWLVEHGKNVVEVARDGTLVEKGNRRIIEIESSEVLRHVIREQLVAWSSSLPQVREVFPEFDSPIVFPIKSQPEAFGFLVLHPEEETEVEIYQLIGQFAAMIFRISELHQKLKEQTEELNEMTEILFKQNAQLSSLYHVELDLMKVADPVHLCRIVVEAAVSELEAKRAAAFLVDGSSRELIGASESGGVEGIDSMRFPIDENEPLKQAIESGRVVTYSDYGDELHLGPNLLEKWIVVCFKGREHVQGVLVTELKDEDIGDSIAILANYSGILLDNLMLQEEVGNVANKTQGRKSDELHQ